MKKQELLYDRRKNLYVGPDHQVIPTYNLFCNFLVTAKDACRGVDGLNYGSRIKEINIMLLNMETEINKIFKKDAEGL